VVSPFRGELGTVAVLGSGPLLRVLRVVERDGQPAVLVEPFTTEEVRPLTPDEAAGVGASAYVVDRYGYDIAATRNLALTFDDGPDERYTPALLDILAREKVPATFFVTGEQAARHPDIVRRIAREGHVLGNHTFTHADMSVVSHTRAWMELVATDRVIRAGSGVATDLFRVPYEGDDPGSQAEDALAILRAQQYGFVVAGYDFDTSDWQQHRAAGMARIGTPELDGTNHTLLLHDAGGDRQATLDYVRKLIPLGKAAGYSFHTMPQMNPELQPRVAPVEPSVYDEVVLLASRLLSVWPGRLGFALCALAVVSVVLSGVANVSLALVRRLRRRRRMPRGDPDLVGLGVSVVISAYNEARVIADTLRSVLATRDCPQLEILVVDDGSTDDTAPIVVRLAADDPHIRLIQQPNRGKAAALNRAFVEARGDIVVTLDADTLFTQDTVANLVRHFATDREQRIAAVAGVVKVGNRRNLLTRWQALDYITQIGVERAAQETLGAIMIVPGACAAWRRAAVIAVGGYPSRTLAEDFDLSLELQRRRFTIVQDDEAVCYTEAPETLKALLKQRTRWMFGSLQTLWKHRRMMFNPRYGFLGMVLLPVTAVSIVLPILFLPLVYGTAVIAVRAQGPMVVLVYEAVFVGVHLLAATVGVALMRESPTHLVMVPLHRLIYEPLRVYLLYTSLLTAVRGTQFGWNKLQRTGSARIAGAPVPGPVPGPRAPVEAPRGTGAVTP
jgi:cellulose synthase/poly-beta-1,6-N-acetylglucosamine synthase-like glycosyltransferase/peptidoglycan/xylan/chitin deacetylase (PgdA/CDA1 family)